MTMSFLVHDPLSEIESADITTAANSNPCRDGGPVGSRVTVIQEKLRIPESGKGVILRQRLLDLLDRSIEQYGATLISGRAGTGKTTLAADYAGRVKKASWFTIEPADADWQEFSASFFASLFGPRRTLPINRVSIPDEATVSAY